jgi:pilus assembly protein CpaF
VASLLDAPDVSEIMINGVESIYVERRGRLEPSRARFRSADELMAALRGLAQWAGRSLDAEHPVLEARLPDGSRVEAVIPPAAPEGPVVAIRRFARSGAGIGELVRRGSLRPEGAEMLDRFVKARKNIVIAGGTGSGKTTLLDALAGCIPGDQRVVVIEDTRELALPHEHVVNLEARPADARGRGEVSVRQLFRATLRLRPDRIVVGEIRGAEALEMIQAMTSGHGGCLATLHATTPADALRRLETMTLMSDVALPASAIRRQLASAVDVIVQVGRVPDGSRRVLGITEVGEHERGAALRAVYGDDEEGHA